MLINCYLLVHAIFSFSQKSTKSSGASIKHRRDVKISEIPYQSIKTGFWELRFRVTIYVQN